LQRLFGNPTMAVLTADHRITPPEAFRQVLASAITAAQSEPVLYTFGIQPTYAATAYGYLEVGERLPGEEDVQHWELLRFREKPDLDTARAFVQSGDFFWNSGMFVWSVQTILAEFGRHLPGHLEILRPAVAAFGTAGWQEALALAFEQLPAISIDYAIMEKAGRVRAVVGDFSWSDLGGWLALQEFLPPDAQGNRHRGQVAILEATGNLVFSDDPEELVALVGVRDLVVVRAGKRTLVVDQAHAEAVKELVRALEREGQGRYV
jgi:mannose-1-phosphate guanylyltransferase